MLAALAGAQPASAVTEEVQTRREGELSVAVYADYAPFSFRDEGGRLVGIDVEIAAALAEDLGLKLVLREQAADESVEDDLRNVVWKGHYLGGGTADVMLHVPIDPVFAKRNDQVDFIAPYFREGMLLARREGMADAPTSATDLIGVPTGVEIDTLADTYLLSALGGRLRDDVRHYTNIGEAMDAMVAGEIDAVLGNSIEVEAAAHTLEGVIVSRVAMPGLFVAQWDLGAAVKSGTGTNLAARLSDAMVQLDEDGKLDEIFSRYGATRVPPSIQPKQ